MDNRVKIQKVGEFLVGFFSLLISNIVSYFAFKYVILHKIPDFSIDYWTQYIITVIFSFMIIFFCFSSPINLLKRSKPMEIASTLRNCVLTYGLISVLLLITKNLIINSRYMFLGSFIIYCASSLVGRFVLKRAMIKKMPNSKYATMTGVITTTARGEQFIPELLMDWSKNVKAVALIDTVYENGVYKSYKQQLNGGNIAVQSNLTEISHINSVPVVANKDNLMGWIRTASLDEVYINLPADCDIDVALLIEELEDMGIVVNVNIPSLETIVQNSKFDNISCEVKADYPMAVFSPTVFGENHLVIKRVFDIVGGIIGTIISLPIILITAIPLLLESPGPLIFKQQRVGKNGRIFNIYKLRSMYTDAEERKQALMAQNKMDGLMFKMDNDPRITKVGRIIRKLSIDELPQFWNVVKGDMSLVGTRPPTIDEFEQYESHHKRRLSLKPGITGMWQVSGRSNIQNFEDVVKLDCEYIDNWSILLDIKILFKTIGVVLTHKGAE